MNFLLDTNILIYSLQKKPGVVFGEFILGLKERGKIFVSAVSRFEVLIGSTDENRGQNTLFLDGFPSHDLTNAIADRAGSLFRFCKRDGITVDNEDLFIAATSFEKGLVLVTTNARHFPLHVSKEKHLVTFKSRRGLDEVKEVHIMEPL
ncbi:MAG: type II toxin-antitoxin system VapC family toxin [Deltaproteobacteria bacterium]|nr:type II toxin-antitoxin system VapC family toxin [Deltaproteobacteria bacterium]